MVQSGRPSSFRHLLYIGAYGSNIFFPTASWMAVKSVPTARTTAKSVDNYLYVIDDQHRVPGGKSSSLIKMGGYFDVLRAGWRCITPYVIEGS